VNGVTPLRAPFLHFVSKGAGMHYRRSCDWFTNESYALTRSGQGYLLPFEEANLLQAESKEYDWIFTPERKRKAAKKYGGQPELAMSYAHAHTYPASWRNAIADKLLWDKVDQLSSFFAYELVPRRT
jgi:hypothetical protein